MARTKQTARKPLPITYENPRNKSLKRDYPSFFRDFDLGLKTTNSKQKLENSTANFITIPKDLYFLIIINACYLTNILDIKKWLRNTRTVCKQFHDFMKEPLFKSMLKTKVLDVAHVLTTNVMHDLFHDYSYQEYARTDVALASWNPEGKWEGMFCNPDADAFLSFSYNSSIWQNLCSTFISVENAIDPFICSIFSNMRTHNSFPVDLFFIQKVPWQLKDKSQVRLFSHNDDWDPWMEHLEAMRNILGITIDFDDADDVERDGAEPPRKKVKRERKNTAPFYSPSTLSDFSKLFFSNFFCIEFSERKWSENIVDGLSTSTSFKINEETKEMFEKIKAIFDTHFPKKNYYYEAYNTASEWIGWSMFIGEMDRFYIVVSCFGERNY